jgi:hypothetical protein
MRRTSSLLLCALLALPALAGCLSATNDAPPAAPTVPAAGAMGHAAPTLDAGAVLSSIKTFSEAYPMRRGNNEAHNAARAELLAGYVSYGMQAIEDEFEAEVSRTSTPTNVLGDGRLVNICGIRWGHELPNEWVVVGAHYDVTDGAVYGAYDDGSGTWIVQKLAEAFATVHVERTVVFCNFDGEEQGLRGSAHMVEAMANGEWPSGAPITNGTVVGMIDFDMAGIMHPAAPVLVADVRSPEMKAIIQNKSAELGIPEEKVEYRAISGGSSDNGPFKAAEIPSVLFISNFDKVSYGPLTLPAGNYPFWHQYDSYEGMVQLAEGEANLKAGFQNVADIGSDLLYHMAVTTMPLTFE